MDRIVRHILIALQESECVVIPTLGAILRHNVPSEYLSSTHAMTPPSSALGFNPQLSLSDGLLLGAYIREERMDPETALRVLEADIRNLKSHLERNAEYFMENLGTFKMDISGRVSFHPASERFPLGSLMGLDNVVIPTLEEMRRQKAIEASERLIREKIQGGKQSAHSFPLWQTVAAAAVAVLIVLGVMVSGSGGMDNVSRAFLSLEEVFTAHKAAPVVSMPKAPVAETVKTDVKASENAIKENAVKEVPTLSYTVPEPSSPSLSPRSYHVIIASLGSSQEAIEMASALISEGHREAKAILLDGKNRVCLSSLSTLEEASALVSDLQKDGGNKDAWILRR